jgi:hypothetical protein
MLSLYYTYSNTIRETFYLDIINLAKHNEDYTYSNTIRETFYLDIINLAKHNEEEEHK